MSTDPGRWRTISPYLDLALEMEADERTALIESLRAGSPGLAAELDGLLDEHRLLARERFLEHRPSPLLPPPALAGQRLGAYTLVAPIGEGGMGAVWLAQRSDGRFERQVAVKFLKISVGGRGGERFRREARILARLAHPRIAQLVDAGVSEAGQPYLVLEYVDGEAIDVYCTRSALDVKARVRLFLDVLGAVAHAHSSLIVHRDIKPSNIVVDGAGKPKLLDFGIAKMLDAAGEPGWTQDRVMTPGYASPEQARGLAPAVAGDIYSLGAVLYDLLTGRSPHTFASDRQHAIEAAICSVDAVPASRLNPAVPRDLECIVGMALRKEPDDRYASADAFADDLRAWLESRPVRARSGNAWYRSRKFLRRYWLPAGAASIVVASLTTGLLIANRQRVIAERRFDQLRQLAGHVIQIDRSLRDLPNSLDARRQLVSVSLEYLKGLAAETDGDLGLSQELAENYERIALVQGVPTVPNLGQRAQAEASLREADRLLDTVLAARPADRRAQLRSAVVAEDRMILAQDERRHADARAHARKAIARADTALRLPGLSDADRTELSHVFGNVALADVNMHLYADAIPYARKSIDLSRTLHLANLDTAWPLSVLASARRYQGDLEGALQSIQEALRLSQSEEYPDPTTRMINLYGVLLREGMILGGPDGLGLGRFDEAIVALQQAFDLSEAGARRDPHDSISRTHVGTAGRELGDVLRDRHPRRALEVYDLAIKRLRETGDSIVSRRGVATVLAHSSYALRRLHRLSEARARVTSALALLRAANDYPSDRMPPESAAAAVTRAEADQLADEGRPADAAAVYERLLKAVLASSPAPLADLRDAVHLSDVYAQLGLLYRRLGDDARETDMEQRRLGVWRHWDQALPDNPFILRQLKAARDPLPSTR